MAFIIAFPFYDRSVPDSMQTQTTPIYLAGNHKHVTVTFVFLGLRPVVKQCTLAEFSTLSTTWKHLI